MGIKKLNELNKFKRFDSYHQFEEFLNLNPKYKELSHEDICTFSVCEDKEYRVYRIMLQPRKVPAGFYVRETWTCFVFEKDDIEMYASEAKSASEENHKLLYDQQHYDD